MKRIARILTLGILSLILTGHACAVADDGQLLAAQSESYGVPELEHALPDEAYDYWGEVSAREAADPQNMLQSFWSTFTGTSQEVLSSAVQNAAVILLVCFIIAMVQSFPMDTGQAKLCGLIGAAALSLICIREASACVPLGFHVIDSLTAFSGRLLPTLCAAAAAGGALTSSGAKYAVSSLCLDLFGTAAVTVIKPALTLYMLSIVSGTILQNEILLSVGSLMKRALRLLLVGTAILFTVFLSLTGVMSGSADAAAAKAAKTTISTVLPVVGGILSDAAGSMIAGAGILRSAIGSLGLFCVLAVCAIPYTSLGIHYLMYQLIGGFSSAFSDKRISALLHGFSDIYAMLLGTAGLITFVVFVSIAALMRGVSV